MLAEQHRLFIAHLPSDFRSIDRETVELVNKFVSLTH